MAGRAKKPEPKPEPKLTEFSQGAYPEIAHTLGIDLRKLGCVMLPVDTFNVTDRIPGGRDDLYVSPNPDNYWVNGAVSERQAHVTLLYGLMRSAVEDRELISLLLEGLVPTHGHFTGVTAFAAPSYMKEPYAAVVATVATEPSLLDAHNALTMLPHMNTFVPYKPHVTLAYVHTSAAQKWIDTLDHWFGREGGEPFSYTGEIDYGTR